MPALEAVEMVAGSVEGGMAAALARVAQLAGEGVPAIQTYRHSFRDENLEPDDYPAVVTELRINEATPEAELETQNKSEMKIPLECTYLTREYDTVEARRAASHTMRAILVCLSAAIELPPLHGVRLIQASDISIQFFTDADRYLGASVSFNAHIQDEVYA